MSMPQVCTTPAEMPPDVGYAWMKTCTRQGCGGPTVLERD